MERILITILLLSFVGVAVFGFAAMHQAQGGDSLCLANVAKAIGCLEEDGAFSLEVLHASIFKSFSIATLAAAVFSLFLLVVGVVIVSPKLLTIAPAKIFGSFPGFLRSETYRKIFAWLEVHEKRDPALVV